MAMYSVDSSGNINVARGMVIDMPVEIRRADNSPYAMIPGADSLMFTVKQSVNTPQTLIQKTVTEALVPLVAADTVQLPFGSYVYDLVLTHVEDGDTWTETVIGPAYFNVVGDDNELLDDYRKLLTSEYKTRPKLTGWLLWLLSEGLSYKNLLQIFMDAFDIDTAVGKQLDIIGNIVGVGRLLNFYPSGGESPLLDDDTYRLVIKARIIQNYWKGSINELYEAWEVLFPAVMLQIQDLQDMTYNVVITGPFTSLMRELITNGYIVPKPEGVRINLMTITDTTGLPLFAYNLHNMTYSGYTAHWVTLAQ